MRSFLAAVLAALALAGGTSLPAQASAGTSLREAAAGERGLQLHLARAAAYDDDDDDEVRPARRWRMDGRRMERPRYTKQRYAKHRYAKPRHARAAKRTWARAHRQAGKSHRASRRAANRSPRHAARSGRIPVRPYPVQAMPAGSGLLGMASFYWQGQTTATGERFNPNGMTAAHRTLPFGTRVRVTHLGNGRSVDVRINDRGPYIAGRMIDLSRGAAGVIGMHHQGVARVKVTVLGR
jgi:rare lipoprotein A